MYKLDPLEALEDANRIAKIGYMVAEANRAKHMKDRNSIPRKVAKRSTKKHSLVKRVTALFSN